MSALTSLGYSRQDHVHYSYYSHYQNIHIVYYTHKELLCFLYEIYLYSTNFHLNTLCGSNQGDCFSVQEQRSRLFRYTPDATMAVFS